MATDRIAKYIERKPGTPAAEARLQPSNVPVWAIVGYLMAAKWDTGRVAKDYELPEEAIQAAADYYDEHRGPIDDRLAANVA